MSRSLEPEQVRRLEQELEGMNGAIESAMAELRELIQMRMEYVHVTGTVDAAIEKSTEPGSNYDHLKRALDHFEGQECPHLRMELHWLAQTFFLIGRRVGEGQIPCTPTIVVRHGPA